MGIEMMDWNSFFSTVAQTSASLLSVVFAFIVARILNEGQDFEKTSNETNYLIIEAESAKSHIESINLDWHDWLVWKEDELYNDRDTLLSLKDMPVETRIAFIAEKIPRILLPKNILEELDDRIREAVEHIERELLGRTTRIYQGEFKKARISPASIEVWNRAIAIEAEVKNVERQIEAIIKKFDHQLLSIRTNVRENRTLFASVTLFIPVVLLTIIYPLHFLPLPTGSIPQISFSPAVFFEILLSIKGFFLTLLSVFSVGLIIFFATVCRLNIERYNTLGSRIGKNLVTGEFYSPLFKNLTSTST